MFGKKWKGVITISVLVVVLSAGFGAPAHAALLRHYAMDDNGADNVVADTASSANASYYTVAGWPTVSATNTSTRHVSGILGAGALDFDGTSNFVRMDNNADLNVTGAFSMSGWVKTADGRGQLFSLRLNGNGTPLIEFGENAGQAFLQVRNDGGTIYTFNAGASVNDGAWHQIAARRRSDGYLELYRDGIWAATSTAAVSGTITTGGNPSWRGMSCEQAWMPGSDTADGRFLGGSFDDLGIWNDALDPKKIALTNGLGRFSGVDLASASIDNVLGVFTAQTGTAAAGSQTWGYKTALGSTTVGATGGSVLGGDAYIVLDASGNGVGLVTASQDIPEPATMALLGLAVTGLGGYIRRRRTAQPARNSHTHTRRIRMRAHVNLFWTAMLVLGIAGAASAALITPTGVVATTLGGGYEPINTINGSGLTGTGASATHGNGSGSGTMWLSNQTMSHGVGQIITFDLGGLYNLSAAYIWQYNQWPGNDALHRGIQQYDIFVAGADGIFPGAPLIADATLTLGNPGGSISAQVQALTATGVQFVRFRVDSTFPQATGDVAGLSEVRFESAAASASDIPEPATLALLGLAVTGLGGYIRRRRTAQPARNSHTNTRRSTTRAHVQLVWIGIMVLAVAGGVQAGLVLPVGATASSVDGIGGWNPGNQYLPTYVADRSGLSGSPLGNPSNTHAGGSGSTSMWLPAGDVGQWISFDLGAGTGSGYNLNAAYVWNYNQDGATGRGIRRYDIYTAGPGGVFGASPVVTNASLTQGGTNSQTQALTASGVEYVKFVVLEGWGQNNRAGLSEVTFEGTQVSVQSDIPEPATMALLGLAATGLGGYLRRRRTA